VVMARVLGKSKSIGVLLGVVSAASATTGTAFAQDAVESEFAAQRFDAAPGPRNFFTTRGVRTQGEMAFSAGLMLNFQNEPLSVRSCVSESGDCEGDAQQIRTLKVVENMFQGDVLGSFTPIERLEIGLKIPVVYAKGHGIDADGQPDPIDATGLGDPALEAKYRIYGESDAPIVAGAGVFVNAPLGSAMNERAYIGDSTPVGGLRGIFDGRFGMFHVGANLGGAFRGTARLGQAEAGSELRYGIAAGVQPSELVRIAIDGFGTTRFSSNPGENTLELDGGVQIFPLGPSLTINAGAGTRLVEGLGAPKVRAFLGVIYSFEIRDRDRDGVLDEADQCPTEPEDMDGYDDSNGCPEQDNDLDNIADSADKCPNQAEDMDGFEDHDGCPDLDNDKDGIPDVSDRCPLEPETKNGFDDTDGCPDVADTDRDGVPDDKDQCVNEAEDTDGFNDTDGCPDPDNDGDGVLDEADECIDEPETINGFEDEDGCPDEKGKKKK
jgi:OOP family OmpA-OmpF porin